MIDFFNGLYLGTGDPTSLQASYYYVPEGYSLVENDEHRKERLQRELNANKNTLAYLERKSAELASKVELQQKELDALTTSKS